MLCVSMKIISHNSAKNTVQGCRFCSFIGRFSSGITAVKGLKCDPMLTSHKEAFREGENKDTILSTVLQGAFLASNLSSSGTDVLVHSLHRRSRKG